MAAVVLVPVKSFGEAKLRDRVTRVFILRLGSADEEVVALCARGIKLSVALGVLQKTALQEALRPVLTDLAFYQKLTLPLLTHLHRLLDLLAGQFNVSLGDKLTEHLKKWVDVERWLAPAPPQPVAWEPGSELAIAVFTVALITLPGIQYLSSRP